MKVGIERLYFPRDTVLPPAGNLHSKHTNTQCQSVESHRLKSMSEETKTALIPNASSRK